MILIDALYINKGGGAVLLQYLIESILKTEWKDRFFFLLDPRFSKPDSLVNNFIVIPNSLKERIKFYKEKGNQFETVFCFANTPPTTRLNAKVYTYMHNQKLLEAPKKWHQRSFWKLYLKYLVIKKYNKNTDYYIVQTKHMVDEMNIVGLKDAAHCLTIPFYDASKYKTATLPFEDRKPNTFAFVSTPSPQKNYPTLLDAWEYLKEQGHTPELHITIDNTAPALLERVSDMQQKGINIHNYSYVDPKTFYSQFRYLICPSIMESFGLPLIEAVDSGMKVLASDLPYVYDVIKPSHTFNPYDKVDMANSVIKAMREELPMPSIVTHDDIEKLIQLLVTNKV